MNFLNTLINKIELNPKKLFFIDGLGAMLSAFILGVILVKFEIIFGIPASILYVLASIPILFAIYDFINYRKKHPNIGYHLKGIAILNLMYCFLSLGLTLYHYKTVSKLGWAYILIEIAIVLFLASIEFKVGEKLIKEAKDKPNNKF